MKEDKYTVIFDMDGVIFDSEKIWKKYYKQTCNLFHIKYSEKYHQGICGQQIKSIVKKMTIDFPEIDANKFWERLTSFVLEELCENGLPLKDKNFANHIATLKNNGFKTALVTGNDKKKMNIMFEKVGLKPSELFDVIVTDNDVSFGKPAPDCYNLACKKLKTKNENCFVLEDSRNGIISAHTANCRTIMVIDLIKPTTEIKNMCEKVCKNMKQALKYISKQVQ